MLQELLLFVLMQYTNIRMDDKDWEEMDGEFWNVIEDIHTWRCWDGYGDGRCSGEIWDRDEQVFMRGKRRYVLKWGGGGGWRKVIQARQGKAEQIN